MTIRVARAKQYNSSWKYILMIDGNPICVTKGRERMNTIMQYLSGADIKIKDGKIKRELDRFRGNI